ncbi:MAG: hypothetical protein IJV45_08045 [Prevotella sp.]|nr:hypothetical protein [Prevotella sp.]
MIRIIVTMLLLAGIYVVPARAAIVGGVRTIPEPDQVEGFAVTENSDRTFRIYAAEKNPGWDRTPCYQKDRFVGLDANSSGSALSACLTEDEGHYID